MGLGPSPTFTGLDHLQPLQQGQLYWAAQDGGVGVRGAVLSYASSSDGLGQLCSSRLIVITEAMDINTHRDCWRATDPVMVLFSSPDQNVIMAIVGSASHSD